MTPLHLSAYNPQSGLMRLLLEKGANVQLKDNQGRTVLHHAGSHLDMEKVALLVDAGCPVNLPDPVVCGLQQS